MVSSVADVTIISLLAVKGVLMTALSMDILAGLFAAAIIFALILDCVKLALFRHFKVS
jgi:H+-transporting ATPase